MSEANSGANGKVFISYSRKDKAFVQKLNDALDAAGVYAWVDWEGIELASDWMKTITDAIQGNDAFLFVISPDSLKSKVCTDELELGIKLNKKLIPILFREPTKTSNMHEKISSTNWVYMREQDNFDETLPKLIQSINTDLGWVRRHTRLLEQAMEWDEQQRNISFLLNGTELEDAEKWMADASAHENRQLVPIQAEYITTSRKQADRRQRMVLAGVSLALVVSIVLSIFAWIARNDAKAAQAIAQTSEAIAIQHQHEASTAQANAEENQQIAEQKKKEAEEKTNLAIANRSAAQSQIYQSRSGELDTSTLLAIDSYERVASFQAEDLIRVNSSQLAMPVKQMAQDGPVWNIEWSPDYQYFVTGNSHDPADTNAVNEACVWNESDGERLFCVQHENDVNDALFTHDGKYLVTGSSDKTVAFWDAKTGQPVKKLNLDGSILDLAVSDTILAIARDDNILTLVYLNKPDLKPENIEQSSAVYGVKFSPNGNYLAVALTDGSVKFWQAANKYFFNGPRHLKSNYVVLAFSPDSNWLVTGGGDSLARLTKRDGTVQYSVPHGDWVEDVAFGPDPSWYVTVSDDNKVRVIDTATGTERLRMSHTNFAQKVEVSLDGQWIASTGYDRVVRIWDAVSGSQMLEFPLDANGSAIAFNKDASRMVAADENGTISIWDISMLNTRAGYIAFPEYVHEARLTPSGEFMIVNTDDYHIWKIPADELGQIKDGTQGESIFDARSLTYDTVISPDSNWVAAVEYDSNSAQNNRGVLVSMDGNTQFELEQGSEVTGIAFDKDSKAIATTGINGLISFWSVDTGEKQSMKFQVSGPAYSLAISPTDTLTAVGIHNRIIVWDMTSGKPLAELAQSGDVEALAFSPDGKWLASGSSNGTIILWKVDGQSFTQNGEAIQVNGNPQVLAFSPEDKWLAGGSTSGFAYLWDVATVKEMARIPHYDPVTGVSFSLDGTQLFTVSRKVVKIWDVNSIQLVPQEQLIPFACSHLVSNLSRDMWTVFFGDEEYRILCPSLPESNLLGHQDN
jgi:WD40 repeat protein